MTVRRLALRSTGFLSFLATQFLGAFNDNAFRFVVIFLVTATFADDMPAKGRWLLACQALFAVPFVLFASWAGSLADRWGKRRIIVLAKLAEILIMASGLVAFALGHLAGLLVVLVLMSTQSTFFGPGKYGYLAETVREHDLARANGYVQMTTMVAIVGGQVTGGWLFDLFQGRLELAALCMIGLATVGWITSLAVPPVPATRPQARLASHPLREMVATWREVRRDTTVLYTVLGIGHFFLLSALLQIDLLDWGKQDLGLSPTAAGVLVATAVLGIGAGSMLAARWSEGRVEMGLVPLGALTMSLGVLGVAFATPAPLSLPEGLSSLLSGWFAGDLLVEGLWRPYLATFVTGVAGGLFIVPLWALLQLHAPPTEKGRYLAFGNAVSFVGIALSAVLLWLPRELEMSFRAQFLSIALLSLAGTFVSMRLLPYAFVRFLAWLLVHTFYRVRVLHEERLPERGGGLLLVNHVSWVDALVLASSSRRRRMHFLMYRAYYEWWPLHWLFKLVGAVPVASGDPADVIEDSLSEAGRLLDEGRLVVVFAEGSVTRLGHMLPFRGGYKRVLGGRDVPVVPVYLGGLWGSLFSHAGGRLLWKLPRAFPYPVTVAFGEALPSTTETHEARHAIHALASECWEHKRADRLPLHVTLLREERRSWRPRLHEDARSLSPARLLARALLLAHRLEDELGPARRVGLAVGPGLAAPEGVLALLMAGRVPVLLDPGVAPDELLRRCELAGLDSVVVGPGLGLPDPVGRRLAVVELARLADRLTARDERRQLLRLALLPWRRLVAGLPGGPHGDVSAPAAVLFTGGATGPSRAVVLSHFNVLSNAEGVQQVLDSDRRDGVLGILPPSHAFGWLTTIWYPLLSGVRVGYHAEPADTRALGRFTERHRLTILPAAPRLLAAFVEGVRPDTFGGLTVVLSGLEPLPEQLSQDFLHTFGLEPCEVYTATECSGVVALNTPNVRAVGVFQRGAHRGTVGHPLAGLSVRIVDERTGETLPQGAEGLVAVRGPSVMTAYLGEPEATAAALRREGLVTGDLGRLDRDGFLTLTDRRGRSSRIDAVTVSHRVVEEAIRRCTGGRGPVIVLGRRGVEGDEQLVVFHEVPDLDPEHVVTELEAQGLDPASIPRPGNFVAVGALRRTAAGLVDMAALREVLSRA